jgi:hypothetical protein
MSERTPAIDKGTADRIEADDGGYWVRLVTKQALRREGVCMGNCLDNQGYGQSLADDEDMVSDGFWSLRREDGLSQLLVEIDVPCATDTFTACISQAKGPMNNQPSGWCVRQLRHLVAAFRGAGCEMTVPERFALTDANGMTWRPDKAPQSLRRAGEERRLDADFHSLVRNDPTFRLIHGLGRVSPLREMPAGIEHGIVIQSEAYEDFETGRTIESMTGSLEGTVQHPPREEQVLTPNDDGTFIFRQTGPGFLREFPRVRVGRRTTHVDGNMVTLKLLISTTHRFSGPAYAAPRRDEDGFFRTRLGGDSQHVAMITREDVERSRAYLPWSLETISPLVEIEGGEA